MSVITTISSSAPSTTPALPAPVTSPRSTTPRPSTRAGGSAAQGRHTLRRRLVASLLAILGAVALTLGMGTGAQASGGLPDCVHGVLGKTALDTSLPANDPRTSGTVISQWLYRSNGRQWVYTGVSTGARAYAGGIWMSGGHMVNELTFYMTPGSGYYIVLEQITRSGQQPVTFWQTYYRQLPGNYYLGYCQA